MIIKKYKARTEKEAILMAKDDLGPEAIVMNVKTIKPGGFMRLIRRTKVELTAAIDDNMAERQDNSGQNNDNSDVYRFGKGFSYNKDESSEETKNAIEEKINSIAKLLEQQMSANAQNESNNFKQESDRLYHDENKQEQSTNQTDNAGTGGKSKVVELIRNQLIENDVSEANADIIVNEIDVSNDRMPIDNILASAYQKIVLKLGEIEQIKPVEDKPKIIFFVGNTGVGKTTTMAKIASKCKLEDKLSVAMFSVDTYRIAAIEQTKTYANILNAPMEVIYTPEDMKNCVEKHKACDLILVDTAGRSHRSEEQRKDLQEILGSVPEYEKEIYLVVSVTTKYRDLRSIADAYSELFDYKIIFTKLDETKGLGSVLNLKLDTGKSLSYVTWGQNVPDDIGTINPQIIAKKLLGGDR